MEIQDILRKAYQDRFGLKEAAERFKSFDTICGATQDRQDALRALLKKPLDLVLIVGGFNSSNTAHLAEITLEQLPFFHIESAEDIVSPDTIRHRDPRTGEVQVTQDWLKPGTRHIGITSGASTPDITLLQILERISDPA